jgi:hypothetical protein
MNFTGSCLCGAVRYRLDTPQLSNGHCQCAICLRANLTAFVSTFGIKRSRFCWTAGESKLSAYEASPGKRRRFCSACGSHLIDEKRDPPRVIVQLPTLDDDAGANPIEHCWTFYDVNLNEPPR